MNGEEKILAILEKIDGKFFNLEAGQAKLDSRLGKLEAGQTKLDSRLGSLEDRLDKVEARLDTLEIGQSVLISGQANLESRFSKLHKDTDIIKNSTLKMEQIQIPRISAALEGFSANEAQLADHERRMHSLEDMTERNILEITALKMAK